MGARLVVSGGQRLRVEEGASLFMSAGTPAYINLVLQSAPLGFWVLDESSGSSMEDTSVNSTTGTLVGADARQGDASIVSTIGGSLFLGNIGRDGFATSYVDLLNNVSGGHPFTSIGDGVGSYTIECWVITGANSNQSGGFGGQAFGGLTFVELRKRAVLGDVAFWFGCQNGLMSVGNASGGTRGLSTDGTPTNQIGDGSIHHCVVVGSGNTLQYYFDGSPSGGPVGRAVSGDLSVGSSACDMRIGCRTLDAGGNDRNGHHGGIACVAIYGTALSGATVAAHYALGSGAAGADRTDYATEVAADSAQNYWRLGEPWTGASIAVDDGTLGDDSPYEFGGTTVNSIGGLIHDYDAAFFRSGFLGVDILDSVAGGHNFTAFGDSSYTLEAWIWLDSAPGAGADWHGSDTIIELRRAGAGGRVAMYFGCESTFALTFGIRDDSNIERVTSSASVLSLNTRHHVAVTVAVSGSAPSFTRTATFYVDGVAVGGGGTFASAVDTVAVGASTCDMQIGHGANDAGSKTLYPFDGMLDEIAIYPSALSPARILAHYNAGIS